jgi:hypothetical protein
MLSSRSIGWALAALGFGIGALVPVFLVAYPAAGISQADAQNPAVVLPAIAANPALVLLPGAIEIATHAVGIVGVVGPWMALGRTSVLFSVATVFGLVWLGVDVVLNAITYHVVPALATANASGGAGAQATFTTTMQLVDAARLGAHVAGGLWMLGVAAWSLATGALPRIVGWLGVAIGAIFAANLFAPPLMNLSFLTVPLWLVIAGIAVARSDSAIARGAAVAAPAG